MSDMSDIGRDEIQKLAVSAPEPEDYRGEDGLLYCGKCHKPKEVYLPEDKVLFGLDRRPAECDCRKAEREQKEKEETERKHCDEVERLKRNGFTDPAMREWVFVGKCWNREKLFCRMYC